MYRAFLPNEANNDTIIKLQDFIGSILTCINGSWAQYNVHEGLKIVPIIYIRELKVIYGTVNTVKLFLNDLTILLINELGFKPNPYDNCVAKCYNQHVDDLIISYVDN